MCIGATDPTWEWLNQYTQGLSIRSPRTCLTVSVCTHILHVWLISYIYSPRMIIMNIPRCDMFLPFEGESRFEMNQVCTMSRVILLDSNFVFPEFGKRFDVEFSELVKLNEKCNRKNKINCCCSYRKYYRNKRIFPL